MNAYAKSNNRDVPINRTYFYMIGPGNDLVEYCIDHEGVHRNDMPELIDQIAAKIDSGDIKQSNSERYNRVWKKRSFFVYYDKDGKLRKDDAVTFSEDKTSFLDGADVSKDNKVYAFYCINHMRKGGKDQEPGDSLVFEVKINHAHQLTGVAVSGEASGDPKGNYPAASGPPLVHDDSGTNTGPPQPAPSDV